MEISWAASSHAGTTTAGPEDYIRTDCCGTCPNDCSKPGCWHIVIQERAEKLLGGLGGEQARWTAAAAQLRADATHVIGDALLSAAIIAYLGPFTPVCRRAVVRRHCPVTGCTEVLYLTCRPSQTHLLPENLHCADPGCWHAPLR